MTSFSSIAQMFGMSEPQLQGFIVIMGLSFVAIGFGMKIIYDDRKRAKKNKEKFS